MSQGIKRGDLDAGAILPSNLGSELMYQEETFHLGDFIADSDTIVTPIKKLTKAITITAVKIGADTAITAADTNYNTIALKNGASTIASVATGPAATG